MKILVVGAWSLLAAALLAACGPNDRVRDNYWGKGENYEPVEHDEYGEPILDEAEREKRN